jgi:hypothetical protein
VQEEPGVEADEEKEPAKTQTKTSVDKTMEQLERLTKELEGQVDLGGEQSTDRYIEHKVKCPEDKKPGDMLNSTNPNIPGQKRTP